MSTGTSLLPTTPTGLTPTIGAFDDYDQIIEMAKNARIVLIGEASHGTHEFYQERARITQRLIDELGFTAVAVEADWPDAYRVNRYALGQSNDRSANEALGDFKRFPGWMWRNEDVADFVEWLRKHNEDKPQSSPPAQFYGLDLYSLRSSMAAVVSYLEEVDPEAGKAARERYSCFDQVIGEGQEYGHGVALNITIPCENEVIAQLIDLQKRHAQIIASDGWESEDKFFYAQQNARLVLNAERYYREMYRGRVSSWNLRDLHMAETLQALSQHLTNHFGEAKIVVWAHNSHVGDARATQMGASGELNVGQLARTTWPNECVNIGFTTSHGTVTAASDWGAPTERKRVRQAMQDSYEALFHDLPYERFFIDTKQARGWLPEMALERAIGVIYRPETERASHWFHARLADQFNGVIHIDKTSALAPLDVTSLWDQGEAPETYPTGY